MGLAYTAVLMIFWVFNMQTTYYPIIIIGSGPAGISNALQLKREGVPSLLIGEETGGCVNNAWLIENLITFPHGISGLELVEKFTEVIERYRLDYLQTTVNQINFTEDQFQVYTSKKKFKCSYLVLATGSRPKKLNVMGETDAFQQEKLFYEVKNLLPEHKSIAIIGSGDVAFDYALNLSQKGNSIKILARSPRIRAVERLQNLVAEKNNIKIIRDFPISQISFNNDNTKVLVSSSNLPNIVVDLVFVAIGRTPNLNLIQNLELLKKELMTTNRFFLIGDLAHPQFRQISLAMGDGIKTAMKLCKIIKKN